MNSGRTSDGRGEADEATRLLHDEECGGGFTSSHARGPTPLPKAQLGVLVAVRIVDPIAYTQIFPYVNQLIADLCIAPPEQVGFYSGFIESAYSIAQMFSVYQWGRISDTIGRRPVVIFTLMGIAVTTIVFGLSTSLVALLASRFLGGLVAGNIAVLHSILVEITDDTNQNMAVPIYSLSWSTGSVVGSLIGGTFANAATRYPKYFSWPIPTSRPTLPSKRKGITNGVTSSRIQSDSANNPESPMGEYARAKALLSIPGLRALTLSGLAISFLASAFDVVFTLFCYTPVDAGGLGLQPSTIGSFLAFAGTFAVLLRLVALPYILHRFNYATTYNTCMYLWPFTFAFLPLLNAYALSCRPTHSETSPGTGSWIGMETVRTEVGVWIGLALVLTLSKVAAIPFSITMLLIKRHAPVSSPVVSGSRSGTDYDSDSTPATSGPEPAKSTESRSALGRCNGLVQLAMCLGRAFGPVVVNPLFTALNGSAWAREWGVAWTWAAVMMCFAVLGARLAKDIR